MEEIITLEEVREFIRTTRSRILPERVADLFEDRLLSLDESLERRDVLGPLVEDLNERLGEHGIDLEQKNPARNELTQKERRMIRSLGLLQVFVADGLYRASRDEETVVWAERAKVAADRVNDFERSAIALDLQASVLDNSGRFAESLRKREEANQIGLRENDNEILQRSLFNQGKTLSKMGEYARAIEKFERVLERVASGSRNESVAAITLQSIATNLASIGDVPAGLQAIDRAILATDSKLLVLMSEHYRIKARMLEDAGETSEALTAAVEALRYARQLKGGDLVGLTLSTIGVLQSALGYHEEALATYREAALSFDKEKSSFENARLEVHRADVFLAQEKPEEAEQIFRILIRSEHPWYHNPDQLSWVLARAGEFHRKLKLYPQAEEHYLKAYQICRDASISRGIIGTLLGLAKLYRESGRISEAIEHYHKLLDHPGIERSPERVIEASEGLADLYEESGMPQKALDYLRLSIRSREEQRERRDEQKIARLRATLEVDRLQQDRDRLREKLRGRSTMPSASQSEARTEEFRVRLRKAHPDLTAGQVRLAELIAAESPSCEITRELEINPESLRKNRSRLRTRLELKRNESLEGYLARFLGE